MPPCSTRSCRRRTRDHDPAQHGDLGIRVDEGDIGVPLVGAASAASRVEFEDRCCSLGRANRRMRHQLAEPHGETLLPRVVEMVLVAEEDDLVFEQDLVDRRDRPVREIARKLDVPDLRADPCRALDDVSTRNDVVDGDCVRHVIFPKTAIPFKQGSAARRSLTRWRSKHTGDGRDRSPCSIAVCSGGNRVRLDLSRDTCIDAASRSVTGC